MKNPEAVIFEFNQGETIFAIRKALEDLNKKKLGIGVSFWFVIEEDIKELKTRFLEKGVNILGEIMDTPFGKALHVKDIDGYKLTFLEKYDNEQ